MNIRFISIKNKSTRNLKGNIKALKGTYIVYVLLCAIFLLGIVLGSLYVAKGRLEDGVIASIEMKTTKSDASEKILYNSLLILFFWIVGLSVIGAPILLFAIFLDGISIGITISYILSTFGLAKGYSFIYIILYVITIINVGVMIMLCQSAINVMYNIIGKNKDIKSEFVRHSGVCILMSIALVVSSILEMYMTQIGKNII